MAAKLASVLLIVLGAGLITANNCANAQWPWLDETEQSTITVAAGADATGPARAVEFRLVACGAEHPEKVVEVPFQATALGELPAFYDASLRVDPGYAFSERSFSVDNGCYRVEARAVDGAGEPVETCDAVRTPDLFLEGAHDEQYALVAGCDDAITEAVEVDGERNHPPNLTDLSVERRDTGGQCEAARVCAKARDRDGDALQMLWKATTPSGARLDLPRPEASGANGRRTECVDLGGRAETIDVQVTVLDRTEALGARPMTREDAFLSERRLVVRSRDAGAVRVDSKCSSASCPDEPAERIDDVTYWITREGTLLAPTDDLSEVRPGDMVDVEFDVAPGCDDTEVTFASYTTSGGEKPRREEAASVFRRTYKPGHHLLWNVVPDCAFAADLHVGEPLDATRLPTDGDPYGDRLIDTATGGQGECASPAGSNQQ